MIRERPSDAFKFVLMHDPALLAMEESDLNRYSMDRDIEKLDIDVDKGIFRPTGELVTIITAFPLRSDAFHLVESGSISFRQIVRTHVVKIVNYGNVSVKLKPDGTTEIPDVLLDKIDFDTLSEIASVIIEKGRGRDGVDRAFFSEATSRLLRVRSRQLPANTARFENVKNMLSRIGSEQDATEVHSE